MFGAAKRYDIQTLALTGAVHDLSEGWLRPKTQQQVQILRAFTEDLVWTSPRHYCYMPVADKLFHMRLRWCQEAVQAAH